MERGAAQDEKAVPQENQRLRTRTEIPRVMTRSQTRALLEHKEEQAACMSAAAERANQESKAAAGDDPNEATRTTLGQGEGRPQPRLPLLEGQETGTTRSVGDPLESRAKQDEEQGASLRPSLPSAAGTEQTEEPRGLLPPTRLDEGPCQEEGWFRECAAEHDPECHPSTGLQGNKTRQAPSVTRVSDAGLSTPEPSFPVGVLLMRTHSGGENRPPTPRPLGCPPTGMPWTDDTDSPRGVDLRRVERTVSMCLTRPEEAERYSGEGEAERYPARHEEPWSTGSLARIESQNRQESDSDMSTTECEDCEDATRSGSWMKTQASTAVREASVCDDPKEEGGATDEEIRGNVKSDSPTKGGTGQGK